MRTSPNGAAGPGGPAALPQLGDGLFLTDGGLETTLIFHDGVDLPCFAAFLLLRDREGERRLRRYYGRYLAAAGLLNAGFVLESPTWRASPDWAERLGVSPDELDRLNRRAIELMRSLRDERASAATPIVVSGCVGPRGDGYRCDQAMSAADAASYHARQIGVFREAGVDMVAAITMTNVPEAVGVVRAAGRAGLPVAVSFTVETDARIPGGESLGDAILAVDAATGGASLYFMVNCAHPDHFASALADGEGWSRRVRGLRANASRLSHAELDSCELLDEGDPAELAADHRALLARTPWITVLGGCCGTDHRHIEAIGRAARSLRPQPA